MKDSPRTALVTGTSSGIGLSTSITLSKAGFNVIATMRDLGKAETLREHAHNAGVQLEVMQLNVQDDNSVHEAVNATLERHGRIDVLVNNAGAGHLGTLEQTSLEEAKRIMDVNFFGVWRVTQAVLPQMRAQGSGRIISVSSIGGLVGQPFNDAYCAAKFALEGAMESLAPVLARFGVAVSLIEPGAVNTAFVANVGGRQHMTPSESDPYQALIAGYLQTVQHAYATANIGQSGEDVAAVILEAATTERPDLRYPTSEVARARIGL
ncbi:MAG: SDR family oxidoreductase, partial [Pleurocapsa sp. SU_196_0]|nr:SDR family oxidoreductase [Pleurocapsa sp. SU_196_0]